MSRRPIKHIDPQDPEVLHPKSGQKVYLEFDRFLQVHTIDAGALVPLPIEIEFDRSPFHTLRLIDLPVNTNITFHVNEQNNPLKMIPVIGGAAWLNIVRDFMLTKLYYDIPLTAGAGTIITIMLIGRDPKPVSRED